MVKMEPERLATGKNAPGCRAGGAAADARKVLVTTKGSKIAFGA